MSDTRKDFTLQIDGWSKKEEQKKGRATRWSNKRDKKIFQIKLQIAN